MLNERMRALRLSRGISQVELARALHISKQSVSNWENDNIQPSIEMLVEIAAFFSVPTDYLLGLDDKRYLEISGLSDEEVSHLQALIDDLRRRGE